MDNNNNPIPSKPISMMTIECESYESMQKVKEMIHEQLVGNQDYIDSNIVLCGSDDISDLANHGKNNVYLYIFKECKGPVPELTIKLGGDINV